MTNLAAGQQGKVQSKYTLETAASEEENVNLRGAVN